MIKRSLFFLILIFSSKIIAQNIAISPYSSFGLGDFKFDNDVNINAMGGISSVSLSELGNEVNYSNPAANRNLYFTSFNVSMNSDNFELKSSRMNEKKSASYVSNLSIGFPLSKKVKFGIGFQPYSGTGYKVSAIDKISEPNTVANFNGDGGLNSLHTITSYSINKDFSAGLRINYLFGNINKKEELIVKDALFITGLTRSYDLSGFQFTPGIYYSKKLKKDYILGAGATYGFSTNLNGSINYLLETYNYKGIDDKVNQTVIEQYKQDIRTKIPTDFTLGASLGKEQKWLIGIQYSGKNLKKIELPSESVIYSNQSKIALGGWFIPNKNSYKSYFSRITYRFGAYYENTGLHIMDQDIKQYALDFGASFPIGNSRQDLTAINFGLELGKRGSISNGLIEENFAKIKIGLNLNDRWFRKRTFN